VHSLEGDNSEIFDHLSASGGRGLTREVAFGGRSLTREVAFGGRSLTREVAFDGMEGASQERELLYMFYIEIFSTDVKIK
jgi:hypothetical protein